MTVMQKLQALLDASNAKTGESDTTLTDAVQTLIDGFGGGGGLIIPDGMRAGVIDIVSDSVYIPIQFSLGRVPFLRGFFVVNHSASARKIVGSIDSHLSEQSNSVIGIYYSSNGTLSTENLSYIDEVTEHGMRINSTLCGSAFVVPAGSKAFWFVL